MSKSTKKYTDLIQSLLKFTMTFFTKLEQIILKCIWSHNKLQITETILWKKEQSSKKKLKNKVTNCSRLVTELEVKDVETSTFPNSQSHKGHKQERENKVIDGWQLQKRGQGSHQRRNEIWTGFCRTKSCLPLKQGIVGVLDKVNSVCQTT